MGLCFFPTFAHVPNIRSMDKNKAWNLISTKGCYYLENKYDEAVNRFIIANMEWIRDLCIRKSMEFHYLPADFGDIGTEKVRYRYPSVHSVPSRSITPSVYAALFPDGPADRQVCGLLYDDASGGGELPNGMALHPIEDGDDEHLKQQFARLLQIVEHPDPGIRFSLKEPEDDVRFSIAWPSDDTPFSISTPSSKFRRPAERVKLPKSEIEQIEDEIRERVQRLRLSDVDELIIQSLFDKEERPSRIQVSKDYRILLPDYGLEIRLAPLTKAIYLLFLKHPEGIRLKELADHENELYALYHRITNRLDILKQRRTVRGIVEPFSNEINIHVSRIRQAFMTQFSEKLSSYYVIGGEAGEAKQVRLPREYVTWETH